MIFFLYQDRFASDTAVAQAVLQVRINLNNLTVLGAVVKECNGAVVQLSN
jgi:hypothetical protein